MQGLCKYSSIAFFIFEDKKTVGTNSQWIAMWILEDISVLIKWHPWHMQVGFNEEILNLLHYVWIYNLFDSDNPDEPIQWFTEVSMFCVLFQNLQHCFEKIKIITYKHPEHAETKTWI